MITRRVGDTAIVVDALKERNADTGVIELSGDAVAVKRFRVAVASNFTADPNVTAVFDKAIETLASLGHSMTKVAVPFAGPERGISHIERDRAAIGQELFDSVDLLLLPTTTTAVPLSSAATGNPQALSPGNTAFANYYGIPAMTVPCGFDSNGLPLGLQIVGKPWGDGDVLSLAAQYQTAAGWFRHTPRVFRD